LVHCFPDGVVVAGVPQSASFVVYAQRDLRAGLPSSWDASTWPVGLKRMAGAMSMPGAAWYAERDPRITPLRDDDGLLERIQWKRLADHAARQLEAVR
jgi:hypothetical protein